MNTHKRVRNCKVTKDGAKSDQEEVNMTLLMISIKFKKREQL